MSRIPDIHVEKHETYKTINVNGFFGGIRDMYLEVLLYSQHLEVEKSLIPADPDGNRTELKRVIEARLIIDPQQLKSLTAWLQTKIVEYEKTYGEILTFKESNDKKNPDSMK